MSEDVQRWKPYYPEMSMVGMVDDERGMWVKWEDYARCARERVRLESELGRIRRMLSDAAYDVTNPWSEQARALLGRMQEE